VDGCEIFEWDPRTPLKGVAGGWDPARPGLTPQKEPERV